jgi:hypothetical protein
MVEIVGTQQIAQAVSAQRTLNNLARPVLNNTVLTPSSGAADLSSINTPSRLNLPGSISNVSSSARPADINIEKARGLIGDALNAAYRIKDALETLSDIVGLAASTSLTSSASAIAPDGTRISGVNIQAAASRISDAIDDLVASTTTNGVSLISSSSRSIRVQTTGYGGRISINPQPLDTTGLNIRDLETVYRADAQEAKHRLNVALSTTLARIETLETLGRSLQFDTATGRGISRSLAAGDGLSTRGYLIDIQA